MADFHNLQGKLEPVTLNHAVAWQIFCASFCDTTWPTFEYCERIVETSYSAGKFFLMPKRSVQVDENFEYNNVFLLCTFRSVITLHVCAVHLGMFSTLGGDHEYSGGYHEYTGGCSVHLGDIMSTLGGYHEYSGGLQ